ncbi:MAG: alpha/beta hydrolase family protein [Pyrinomonadaceae bacterium]
MSALNRTIVAFALVIMKLTICDAFTVNGRRPQEPRPPYPYYAEEVVFENEKYGVRLAGTLTLPLSKGPFPAVVLCTGTGPQDRDETVFGHKPFLLLADYFTRLGIAVLRVDDRGVGKSTGSFSEATSEDFAADALAGIEYLKTRQEIAPEKIGLLGHCEGGLIVPIVAAQSRDVAFVVMMGGPGLKGEQVVIGAGGIESESEWIGDELIAQNRAAQERIFAIIRQEQDRGVAETKIRKEAVVFSDLAARIKAESTGSKKKKAAVLAAAIESQAALFLSPWFRFYLTYDPQTALMKVKCPVLAINGDKDIQVPAKENLEAIRKALELGENKDYTVLILPNLNHLFQNAETGAISEYERIEETISVLALDTVSNWILKHTTSKSNGH